MNIEYTCTPEGVQGLYFKVTVNIEYTCTPERVQGSYFKVTVNIEYISTPERVHGLYLLEPQLLSQLNPATVFELNPSYHLS